jgi:hypothetical protein
MEKVLDDLTQRNLREQKVISADEVALKVGDLFLAENVLNKSRRKIDVSLKLTEHKVTPGLLKG